MTRATHGRKGSKAGPLRRSAHALLRLRHFLRKRRNWKPLAFPSLSRRWDALASAVRGSRYEQELRILEEIASSDEAFGANLTRRAYGRITDRRLRDQLLESDKLVDTLRGAKRLRERRRRGILRHTKGPDRGLPFFRPLLDRYRTRDAPEPRIFALKDELEYLVISGRGVGQDWRPVKDELTFDEARAIAGMKAGTLYAHTAERTKVPGQLCRPLGDDLDRNVHELRFKTEEFMKWAILLSKVKRTRKKEE